MRASATTIGQFVFCPVHGGAALVDVVWQTYQAAGGVTTLGCPLATEQPTNPLPRTTAGFLQRFQYGTIYRSRLGCFAVFGQLEEHSRRRMAQQERSDFPNQCGQYQWPVEAGVRGGHARREMRADHPTFTKSWPVCSPSNRHAGRSLGAVTTRTATIWRRLWRTVPG